MSESFHHPHLVKVEHLVQAVRALMAETAEPGVAVALRHALYYLHVSGSHLGDEKLSPEVDADLEFRSGSR